MAGRLGLPCSARSLAARARATSRRGPAPRSTGHCWVLMVNSTAPVRGQAHQGLALAAQPHLVQARHVRGERRRRLVGLGAEQLVVAVDRQVASHHRSVGPQPLEEGVDLGLELARRSGGPGRGWRPPSGPASRAGASATGSTARRPRARYGPSVGHQQAQVLLDEPPGPVQRVESPSNRCRAGAPSAAGVGGQPGLRSSSRTSVRGGLGAGTGREHLLGALGQQLALERQLARRSLVDRPASRPGPVDGAHRQPRRTRLEGQLVEPVGGGRAGAGSTFGRSTGQVWTIPAWNCAPRAAMLSPLCATALTGPAPHGPDRISTDVCAGQCSSGRWNPAAQLRTGAPPGFPSGALA